MSTSWSDPRESAWPEEAPGPTDAPSGEADDARLTDEPEDDQGEEATGRTSEAPQDGGPPGDGRRDGDDPPPG